MSPIYNILSKGQMDDYLRCSTGSSRATHWFQRFSKACAFAMELKEQPINAIALGEAHQISLYRSGDLLSHMFLEISVPAIKAIDKADGEYYGLKYPCEDLAKKEYEEYLAETGANDDKPECCKTNEDVDGVAPELAGTWAHWVNALGFVAVKECSFEISSYKQETLYGQWMMVWEELTGKSGKRCTEMTGTRYTREALLCDALQSRTLYVPLSFWFTRHPGLALPIAGLTHSALAINLELRSLEQLIRVSGPNTQVVNAATNQSDINLPCKLLCAWVHLDKPEREYVTSKKLEMVVMQSQRMSVQCQGGRLPVIKLPFQHPCTELIVVVQKQSAIKSNMHDDFSGVGGGEPLKKLDLKLNNCSRFNDLPASVFRLVTSYIVHSNNPEIYTYTMPFSTFCEESNQYSGSLNLSRIDSCDLCCELAEGMKDCTITVYAMNYNVFVVDQGVGNMKFG